MYNDNPPPPPLYPLDIVLIVHKYCKNGHISQSIHNRLKQLGASVRCTCIRVTGWPGLKNMYMVGWMAMECMDGPNFNGYHTQLIWNITPTQGHRWVVRHMVVLVVRGGVYSRHMKLHLKISSLGKTMMTAQGPFY